MKNSRKKDPGFTAKQHHKKRAHAFLPKRITVLCMIILLPGLASAVERYSIDFADSHIRGFRDSEATLYLKKSFKAQYPWLRLRDYNLRKVVLVAKSKYGRGRAALRVGQERGEQFRVAGFPRDFRNHRRYSFDTVHLYNPSCSSHGRWQIRLNGNFIVREVVVVLEKKRAPRYRDREFWYYFRW